MNEKRSRHERMCFMIYIVNLSNASDKRNCWSNEQGSQICFHYRITAFTLTVEVSFFGNEMIVPLMDFPSTSSETAFPAPARLTDISYRTPRYLRTTSKSLHPDGMTGFTSNPSKP